MQSHKAEQFQYMHKGDGLFVLPNCWDAVSAKVLERAGYEAIGTASAAMSWLYGVADGENLTREQLVSLVRCIVKAVDVPVSVDIEKGHGHGLPDVKDTIKAVLDAGAVGINIEDSIKEQQRPIAEMQARISAAREVAVQSDVRMVINARVDAYLLGYSGEDVQVETITRGNAWLDAGADCVFVPGINDKKLVETVAEEIKGPVNIIVLNEATPSVEELSRLGVKRVSLGPRLMQTTIGLLEKNAARIVKGEEFDWLSGIPTFSEINSWFQ